MIVRLICLLLGHKVRPSATGGNSVAVGEDAESHSALLTCDRRDIVLAVFTGLNPPAGALHGGLKAHVRHAAKLRRTPLFTGAAPCIARQMDGGHPCRHQNCFTVLEMPAKPGDLRRSGRLVARPPACSPALRHARTTKPAVAKWKCRQNRGICGDQKEKEKSGTAACPAQRQRGRPDPPALGRPVCAGVGPRMTPGRGAVAAPGRPGRRLGRSCDRPDAVARPRPRGPTWTAAALSALMAQKKRPAGGKPDGPHEEADVTGQPRDTSIGACPDCGDALLEHEVRIVEGEGDVLYHRRRDLICWRTLRRITASMREQVEPGPGVLPRRIRRRDDHPEDRP